MAISGRMSLPSAGLSHSVYILVFHRGFSFLSSHHPALSSLLFLLHLHHHYQFFYLVFFFSLSSLSHLHSLRTPSPSGYNVLHYTSHTGHNVPPSRTPGPYRLLPRLRILPRLHLR